MVILFYHQSMVSYKIMNGHHQRFAVPRLLVWAFCLFILFVVGLTHTFALADEYADALKKAKTEDKPIVLYFYSKYCGYCTAMDKNVLADKEIASTMNNSLVYLRVNVDNRNDLASKYGIRGYPTTCLLEPSGKGIIAIPGYVDKKEFKLILAYAQGKHYKTTKLRQFLKKAGIDVG